MLKNIIILFTILIGILFFIFITYWIMQFWFAIGLGVY